MDLKFLQHRLSQLRDRTDIGVHPPQLPELVEELVVFEEKGFDFEHGLVVLDKSGRLLTKNKCPVLRHDGEHKHEGEEFLQPFFYKKDEILVAPWAVAEVEAVIARQQQQYEVLNEGTDDQPLVLKVEDAGKVIPEIARSVASRVNDRNGLKEPAATYNRLFFASPIDCGSPAGDPRAPGGVPALGAPGAGAGVSVAVLDTGILPDYMTIPALASGVEFDDPQDIDGTYYRGYIHFPGCHGTFAAGVVRRVAPAAKIVAIKVLDFYGVGTESDVADGIRRAVDKGVDIINLSLTCPGAPDDEIALALQYAVWAAADAGIAMVGAVGNAGRPEVTWPAYLVEVLGVGAVDEKGHRAHFSNYGDWVEVWARGEDVVNAFGTGPYRPLRGGPTINFAGYATWSGTSFATPLVSGLIAARMASDGTKPLDAQQAVLADTVRSLALGPGADGNGAYLVTLDTTVSYPPSPPAPPPGP